MLPGSRAFQGFIIWVCLGFSAWLLIAALIFQQ
jgi:hypothetical protein